MANLVRSGSPPADGEPDETHDAWPTSSNTGAPTCANSAPTMSNAGTCAVSVPTRRWNATAAVSAPTPLTIAIRTNPAWNPDSPARDTSAVDTAATPAAPPTSRIVSTRPEAIPDDDSATPDSALIWTDGAHKPIAIPATRNAGSRSDT